MTTTTNTLLIAFFDGIGESITPTANFTPGTGYPLSNLTNSQLFSRCRTPDLTTDRQLTWDLGSAIEFNTFMLAGTNATQSAIRRFRIASDSGFTSNVVESGSSLTSAFDTSLGLSRAVYVPPWGRTLLYILSQSYSRRYVRWHQSDSTNADGYQEWAIARIGLSLQFEFQEWRKPPTQTNQKVRRGHEITLHNLTREQVYTLESILLTILNTRRILIIPEALATETYLHDAVWGVVEELYTRETITDTPYDDKRYRMTLMFREVDR